MFIFNVKMNKKAICIGFIIVSLIVVSVIMFYSIYVLFFRKHDSCANDKNNIIYLNETNYANILKAANEDIDSYLGLTVNITGYVYRLIDFNDNQFVIARDMKISNTSPSLVVGFLCESKDASQYPDGTWLEIIGKIKKGKYNEELAILDVTSIKETNRPNNIFVRPPDKL